MNPNWLWTFLSLSSIFINYIIILYLIFYDFSHLGYQSKIKQLN